MHNILIWSLDEGQPETNWWICLFIYYLYRSFQVLYLICSLDERQPETNWWICLFIYYLYWRLHVLYNVEFELIKKCREKFLEFTIVRTFEICRESHVTKNIKYVPKLQYNIYGLETLKISAFLVRTTKKIYLKFYVDNLYSLFNSDTWLVRKIWNERTIGS